MKKEDYYEILGVSKDVDEDSLKKAYRKKAMQFHPDKNPNDKNAEEMFKKISEAYGVLSDSNKRRQYDSGGDIGSFSINPNDIYASFFGNRDFSFSFGNQAFRNNPRISQDTKGVYRANLKDIITGAKVEIKLEHQKSCDKCFGSGHKDNSEKCKVCNGQGMRVQVNGHMIMSTTCNACSGTGMKMEKCNHCKGAGYHTESEKISLSIPYGINPMTTLRIQGKGNEIFIDKQRVIGDAYIIIDYSPRYKGVIVENGNIYTSINVPFTSVLNEDKIEVDILGCKNISFNLNPNYKSGHMYKIEKEGIKEHNAAFVKVFIDLPKKDISEEDRKKLNKLIKEIYGEFPTRFKPNTDNDSGS